MSKVLNLFFILSMGIPAIFGGLQGYPSFLSNFRNPLIIFTILFFPLWSMNPAREWLQTFFEKPTDCLSDKKEKVFVFWIVIFFCLVYLKVAFLNYFSFQVSANDFSVYDYLIPETAWGRFMQSPACSYCNHFGVHSTPILFLLYPVHRFFNSPLFFICLHPIVLALGSVPLIALTRLRILAPVHRVLVVISYFFFAPLITTLDYNFHIEIFYIPLGLSLIYFLEKQSWLKFAIIFLLYLAVKEDGAIYASALAGGALMSKMERPYKTKIIWLTSLIVIASLTFWLNSRVILPRNRGPLEEGVKFWSKYGNTPIEILDSFLRNWGEILGLIVNGGWLKILGLVLWTPLFFLGTALPSLVFGLIHSTANAVQVQKVDLYYACPLIPFCFGGLIIFLSKNSLTKKTRSALVSGIVVLNLFFGEYLTFSQPNPKYKDFTAASQAMDLTKKICSQGVFVPHLNYIHDLNLLSQRCLENKVDYFLINEKLNPYPLRNSDVSNFINLLSSDSEYEKLDFGGFLVFRKKNP